MEEVTLEQAARSIVQSWKAFFLRETAHPEAVKTVFMNEMFSDIERNGSVIMNLYAKARPTLGKHNMLGKYTPTTLKDDVPLLDEKMRGSLPAWLADDPAFVTMLDEFVTSPALVSITMDALCLLEHVYNEMVKQ
jgi:hypothetical protein